MRCGGPALGLVLAAALPAAGAAPNAQTLDARLTALEQRLAHGSGAAQGQVQLVTQLQQLEAEVRALRGQVEESANRLELIEKRQRDLYLDLDRRLVALEGGAAPAPDAAPPSGAAATAPPPPGPATPPLASAPPAPPAPVYRPPPAPPAGPAAPVEHPSAPAESEQALYRAAYDELRAGRYDSAISGFRELLKQYPQGDLADNAVYWIGEAYYVTRQYDLALAEFQRVVTEYPSSPKAGDAMLKLGYVHYNRREYAAARSVLTELTQNWPASAAARLAESQLRRMQEEGV